MDTENLAIMRTLFTALQAETALRYTKGGIYKDVEKEKRDLSLASGEKNCRMLGIAKPEEAFQIPAAVTECAVWDIETRENGLTAVCRSCKLDGMCKAMNTATPCDMYCLNPIEGMIKVLQPDADFQVKSTLYESDRCEVVIGW